MVRSMEMLTFLDDQAEDEVANERHANNGEVEDDVGPAEIGHQSNGEWIKVRVNITLADSRRWDRNNFPNRTLHNQLHTGFRRSPGYIESLD